MGQKQMQPNTESKPLSKGKHQAILNLHVLWLKSDPWSFFLKKVNHYRWKEFFFILEEMIIGTMLVQFHFAKREIEKRV